MILVGHEPWPSQFLAAALAGPDARVGIEFKKGGAASVEFAWGHPEPGSGDARMDAAATRAARIALAERWPATAAA